VATYQNRRKVVGKPMIIVLLYLVDQYGWKKLGDLTGIKQFELAPNFTSSLVYLRKRPKARKSIEELYLLCKSVGENSYNPSLYECFLKISRI